MKWGFKMNNIIIAFILFLIFAVLFLMVYYIGPVIIKNLCDLLEKFWRKILKDDDILSDKVNTAVFLSLLFIIFMISGVIAEICIM